MGRIKQGLDYFPLSTDFMHDRIVRRVMKREGDSAFTVLIYIMSYIYSGEGYYVRADNDFCDELSDQLFNTDNDTVHRVIHLFLEYGLFDSALYERYSILTSADVQRQYLFITKRRSQHNVCPDYCLLAEEKATDGVSDTVAETGENVTVSPDIVTVSRNAATKTALIKRKEKEKKEKSTGKDWKQNRPTKLKFTYKEQREYETIDDDIAALEEKIKKLDDDMIKNATNSGKLTEIMREKETAEAQLEEKMDRWVYLNDLAEKIEAQK